MWRNEIKIIIETRLTKLISWCEQRSIDVKAFHIEGKKNVVEDLFSRNHSDSSNWRLDPCIFSLIKDLWEISVDLFASRWNAQMDSFVSWGNQPDRIATHSASIGNGCGCICFRHSR